MSSNPASDGPSALPGAPLEPVPWDRVDHFVGQLSHDIRNGLNACELQLTFLGEITAEPDAVEDIKRLRAVIAGITRQLQAVRVAMSGATAHLMDYAALDLFEDLRERFERAYPEQVARVKWETALTVQKVTRIDPELVLSSSLELLKNALHFADKDSPITCDLRGVDDTVQLSFVQSQAEPPDTSLAAWGRTPFASTRRGAYGLGLFRARRALEAGGDKLTFEWSPALKTLTAAVTLPGATPAATSS